MLDFSWILASGLGMQEGPLLVGMQPQDDFKTIFLQRHHGLCNRNISLIHTHFCFGVVHIMVYVQNSTANIACIYLRLEMFL